MIPKILLGRVVLLTLVAVQLASPVNAAFDAATAFEKKCSGCHTIGGGVLKGPDLKGVGSRRDNAWLVKFVQSSATMIESGDAEAVKLFNQFEQREMPDQRLSDAEVLEVVKYIEGGVTTASTKKVKSALDATPEDIAKGKAYFMGVTRFKNGGTACISCHSAGDAGALGGGVLAKDLTTVYSTYKDEGLSMALELLAFPIMVTVFENKALTEEEIYALKAFFYTTDLAGVPTPNYQKKFLFLGIGGTVLSLGVIDFTWRRRRKNSVRRPGGGVR